MPVTPCSPADSVISFTERYVSDIQYAPDRPWYFGTPAPQNVAHWEYGCHCSKTPVRVSRHVREGRKEVLYLGQCPRCQAVIWTYCYPPKG
jgi:hypothetical protein